MQEQRTCIVEDKLQSRSQPNIALNRHAAIWPFIYFYAFAGRARLALR